MDAFLQLDKLNKQVESVKSEFEIFIFQKWLKLKKHLYMNYAWK